VGKGKRVDRPVQELAGDGGDHSRGPQVCGEDAVAHDQLFAVQRVDQSAGGVAPGDELVTGDP
jgi:hypothetical protein